MTSETEDQHFTATWCIDVWAKTHEEGALMAASSAKSKGSTATVYSVKSQDHREVLVDTADGKASVLSDERAVSNQELIKQMVEKIQDLLKQVLVLSIDPVSIKVNDLVDIELRPIEDQDSRVTVGRKDWGFTTVNYTTEGLIVDVISEDISELWTGSFTEDLLGSDSAENESAWVQGAQKWLLVTQTISAELIGVASDVYATSSEAQAELYDMRKEMKNQQMGDCDHFIVQAVAQIEQNVWVTKDGRTVKLENT
jgi:hypothetical protein